MFIIPTNYKIFGFFLSELSNIPGQFTYLLIKIKQANLNYDF